jgi:hypothetical protein
MSSTTDLDMTPDPGFDRAFDEKGRSSVTALLETLEKFAPSVKWSRPLAAQFERSLFAKGFYLNERQPDHGEACGCHNCT